MTGFDIRIILVAVATLMIAAWGQPDSDSQIPEVRSAEGYETLSLALPADAALDMLPADRPASTVGAFEDVPRDGSDD